MSDHLSIARPPGAQQGVSPFRLNLEQQRKRAKELLAQLRAGDADALRRFQHHHPARPSADTKLLSEAQLVIARELGLPSWPRLKRHIEAMDRWRAQIARGEAAPDRGMATLHIRCGSDIGATLKEAGFAGDFLEYSDPLCQGPVLDEAGWLDRRATFLAERYAAGTGQSHAQIATKLHLAEEQLRSAAARYQRVVLWFEHDSHDQLILARCLAQFAETPPKRLELISAAHFPGGTRFIGLGQLPPEALRLLWEARRLVSGDGLQAGCAVWATLRSSDPRPLADLARTGIAALPQLARAVRRHCQEFPWTRNGLSLTEHLILEILAQEPLRVGQVFGRLMMEREPLPWMGDLMFRATVDDMKRAAHPVFTGVFEDEHRHWTKERLTITPLGRAVLTGRVDWLSLQPPPRWLGGVLLPGEAPCWRWEPGADAIVRG